MSKKTTTYVLLSVVIVIWAVIVWRIFGYISQDSTQQQTAMPVFKKDSLQTVRYDTVQLNLRYPDPFLKQKGAAYIPSQQNTEPIEKPATKKVEQPKPIQTPSPAVSEVKPRVFWPQIQYDGTIMSKGSKLAMLRINGQSYIVALGKSEQDVLVKRIYQDSILLLYKHEEKTISKK